jgi:hypothetical protein
LIMSAQVHKNIISLSLTTEIYLVNSLSLSLSLYKAPEILQCCHEAPHPLAMLQLPKSNILLCAYVHLYMYMHMYKRVTVTKRFALTSHAQEK